MIDIAALEEQILSLDRKDRGRLASKILESLEGADDDISEEENIKLWAEEAARRNEEMESGKVKGIPYEEVIKELRAKYT